MKVVAKTASFRFPTDPSIRHIGHIRYHRRCDRSDNIILIIIATLSNDATHIDTVTGHAVAKRTGRYAQQFVRQTDVGQLHADVHRIQAARLQPVQFETLHRRSRERRLEALAFAVVRQFAHIRRRQVLVEVHFADDANRCHTVGHGSAIGRGIPRDSRRLTLGGDVLDGRVVGQLGQSVEAAANGGGDLSKKYGVIGNSVLSQHVNGYYSRRRVAIAGTRADRPATL